MWGTTPGYVRVPTNHFPTDRWDDGTAYSWPESADTITAHVVAADAAGLDCYYSTNVMRSTGRARGNSAAPHVLHLDLDRTPTAEDIDRLDALDAMTVLSGSKGHLHAYVFLDGPTDTSTYHILQQRLRAYFGKDVDSKISDNDVLRIPGTHNRKDGCADVALDRETDTVWSVAELSELLPEVAISEAPAAPSGPIEPELVSEVPPRVAEALEKINPDDRSASTFAVLKDCARAGLSRGQAMTIVQSSPPLAERWSQQRGANFVSGEIAKAYGVVVAEPVRDEVDLAELMGVAAPTTPVSETPRTAPGRSLRDRMLTVDQLGTLPSPEPLVEGLLYRNTLAQLVGAPGTYKSFAAMGMACALATRQTTFEDHPIGHSGPVIYVAAEGASGMQARIEAWAQSTIPEDTEAQRLLRRDLLVLPEVVDVLDESVVSDLIVAANESGAVLIVLDTRARMTVGADENSAKEMGLAIAQCERLRTETGATVLVIHHAGKQGTSGRGSNAWDGAVWTQLLTSADDARNLTITADKHKEIASGDRHRFILKTVVVDESRMPGTTEEQRSTLVVQNGRYQQILTDSHDSHQNGVSKADEILTIFSRYSLESGLTAAQVLTLGDEFGLTQATVYRVIKELVKAGKLKPFDASKVNVRYVETSPTTP